MSITCLNFNNMKLEKNNVCIIDKNISQKMKQYLKKHCIILFA